MCSLVLWNNFLKKKVRNCQLFFVLQLAKIRAKMKKMEFNRDVEQIKYLIAHYENSTLENKKIILEELDYYLHQFDNANDFIFLKGFEKIVIPGNI